MFRGTARLVILDEFKGEHVQPSPPSLSLCDFVERVRGRPYASPRRARASLMYVIPCASVHLCMCVYIYVRVCENCVPRVPRERKRDTSGGMRRGEKRRGRIDIKIVTEFRHVPQPTLTPSARP